MKFNSKHDIAQRADRREANEIISRIVFHADRPDVQPVRHEHSPFVCEACGHVRELCICQPARVTA